MGFFWAIFILLIACQTPPSQLPPLQDPLQDTAQKRGAAEPGTSPAPENVPPAVPPESDHSLPNTEQGSSSERIPSGTENHRQQRTSIEFPTGEEKEKLPSCNNTFFTHAPVDLGVINEITPLGNLGPPGHTFPTEHTFIHLHSGGSSSVVYPLSAPADIFITSMSKGVGFTQDPVDYTIYFALCKEVIGYHNHVKELSPELEQIFASGKCNWNPGDSKYTYCENSLNLVKAGSLLGKVGGLQGNFDLGMIDTRETLLFANPSRYGMRSLHIQCPYDYYVPDLKAKLLGFIKRTDSEKCGTVAQDILGTLQGNWFFGEARADMGSDWNKYLAFVNDNTNPSLQVISIGGQFTNAGMWTFSPETSGAVNRDFSQVKPGEEMYCYHSEGQQGKILVKLTSATELQIEKQEGSCSGQMTFRNPTKYGR